LFLQGENVSDVSEFEMYLTFLNWAFHDQNSESKIWKKFITMSSLEISVNLLTHNVEWSYTKFNFTTIILYATTKSIIILLSFQDFILSPQTFKFVLSAPEINFLKHYFLLTFLTTNSNFNEVRILNIIRAFTFNRLFLHKALSVFMF